MGTRPVGMTTIVGRSTCDLQRKPAIERGEEAAMVRKVRRLLAAVTGALIATALLAGARRRRPGRPGRSRHPPEWTSAATGSTEPLRLRADTRPDRGRRGHRPGELARPHRPAARPEADEPRSEVHGRGARRRRAEADIRPLPAGQGRPPGLPAGQAARPGARPRPAGSSAGSTCPRRCAPSACRWSGGSTRSPAASAAASGSSRRTRSNPVPGPRRRDRRAPAAAAAQRRGGAGHHRPASPESRC